MAGLSLDNFKKDKWILVAADLLSCSLQLGTVNKYLQKLSQSPSSLDQIFADVGLLLLSRS
jgi:hypothetical protein